MCKEDGLSVLFLNLGLELMNENKKRIHSLISSLKIISFLGSSLLELPPVPSS